jgi:predicted transcriptional regulator YdeE
MNPQVIKRGALIIAGVFGDGSKTGEVWEAFTALNDIRPIANKISDSGYEIRFYNGVLCTVHVGVAVTDASVDDAYSTMTLPASEYASFEVCAANGYDSENSAMDEWLKANRREYSERLLKGVHYCVEYYDERFHGNEPGSIMEIWIPIERSKYK